MICFFLNSSSDYDIIQNIQKKIHVANVDKNLFNELQEELQSVLENYYEKFLISTEFKSLIASNTTTIPPLNELAPEYFKTNSSQVHLSKVVEVDEEEEVEDDTEDTQ
jgi:hypothetical protein